MFDLFDAFDNRRYPQIPWKYIYSHKKCLQMFEIYNGVHFALEISWIKITCMHNIFSFTTKFFEGIEGFNCVRLSFISFFFFEYHVELGKVRSVLVYYMRQRVFFRYVTKREW